jgi:dolichol-phosphate mannosyltransferase
VKAIRLSRNFGHQVALSAGLEYAAGDAVIVMDGDLQHPADVIPELIARWEEGFDVVYTIRNGRHHAGLLKRVTASLFYRILNRLSDVDLEANTPDFRLMDRRVVDILLRLPERGRFLRGLVRWVGLRQTAVPFTADPRRHGTTKYPFSRMVRFSLDGLTSFSTVPLRFASYLGTLVALSAIPYALWAVYVRLFTDEAVTGWASLVVALLMLGGVQLFCLGIVGEYIGRMYEEVKGRPLYITDEVIGDLHPGYLERLAPRSRRAAATGIAPPMIAEELPAFAEKVSE